MPMVRVTWMDARDTETGWIDIKDIMAAPLATCQEVGWMTVNNDEKIVIMCSWCLDRDDNHGGGACLLYTSPSPRDGLLSRMPSSA